MTTLTDRPRGASRLPGRRVTASGPVLLRALIAWHALLGLALIALVVGAFVTGAGPRGTSGAVIGLLVVALLVADLAAVPLLAGRRHLGRVLAMGVSYLGFLACALLLLQTLGAFTGLDALGGTFIRGVPFLAVALVAFVVGGIGDRGDGPGPFARAGRIVALVALAGLLVAVGVVPALGSLVRGLADPVAIGLLAGVVVFGFFARLAWSESIATAFDATSTQREALDGLLYVSPNVLGFLLFFVGPLLFSLYASLTDWDLFSTPVFVGLDNYVQILSLDVTTGGELSEGFREVLSIGGLTIGARDPLFWISMRNIALFAVMAIPLAVLPALVIATALNTKAPGMRVFRAIYFVPTVAGVVGVTLIWKQLFNATVGYVNYGMSVVAGWFGATAPQPQWLSDADISLFSLVIVFVWQYIGYNTILFLAGLQGLPADLYEAAHLDGANGWQRFRYITIPQLAPTTFFVVATTGIFALQLFTESVILFSNFTPPGAGPNNAALTPVGYLYQEGFQRFSPGYASAVAWLLFFVIFAFTFVQFQRQRAAAEGV